MTNLETTICNMVQDLKSNEIESIIAELQMIADDKYEKEEEEENIV